MRRLVWMLAMALLVSHAAAQEEGPVGVERPDTPRDAAVDKPDADAKGFKATVDPGGGFAGLRIAEVIASPAYSVAEDGTYAPTDSLDLTANRKYLFKPCVSIGVVFRYTFKDDGFRLGLGTHAVFIPAASGTRTVPGITIQGGQGTVDAFMGLLFSPVDEVRFPNGKGHFRVPAGANQDFVVNDTGTALQFYFGFVVKGVPLTTK